MSRHDDINRRFVFRRLSGKLSCISGINKDITFRVLGVFLLNLKASFWAPGVCDEHFVIFYRLIYMLWNLSADCSMITAIKSLCFSCKMRIFWVLFVHFYSLDLSSLSDSSIS